MESMNEILNNLSMKDFEVEVNSIFNIIDEIKILKPYYYYYYYYIFFSH